MKTYYQLKNNFYLLPLDSRLPNLESLKFSWLNIIGQKFKQSVQILKSQECYEKNHIKEILNKLHSMISIALNDLEPLVKSQFINFSDVFSEDPRNPMCVYTIYDTYFGIKRYSSQNALVFLNQALIIIRDQLQDLINSQISLHDLIPIVDSMALILERFNSDSIVGNFDELKIASNLSESIITKNNPLKRWKIGHAYFNLVLMFSADYLMSAIESIEKNIDLGLSQAILNASDLFKASTSAMWAASIFNEAIYNNVIRPSMISTEMPTGFSGNQNREFEFWREVKNHFKKSLQKNIKLVSSTVISAVKHFDNIYQNDGEQHIVIANALVGNRLSLTQEDCHNKYGIPNDKGAVSLLRQILEFRKKEFSFIYEKL